VTSRCREIVIVLIGNRYLAQPLRLSFSSKTMTSKLNLGRLGMTALKAGSINEKEHIQPQFNVYASSKVPCKIIDESIPAFDKMPG